jgi:hypothetical protein
MGVIILFFSLWIPALLLIAAWKKLFGSDS